MIKGSHDTMSYLTPSTWWGKIIRHTARCQTKGVMEQYNAGCRYFDFRIRREGNRWVYAHGIITYKSQDSIGHYLSRLYARGEKCYIRILLEPRFKKSSFAEKKAFIKYCDSLVKKYPEFELCYYAKYPYQRASFSLPWCEVCVSPSNVFEAMVGPKHYLSRQRENIYARERDGYCGIAAMDFV